MKSRFGSIQVLAGLVVILSTHIARANLVKDVGMGLGIAGLHPQITRDVFQDGWTLDYGTAFYDQTYDFGNVELTLNGALTGQFSIGQWGIDEFEFSLETPGGLAFELVEFIGPDKTQIESGLLDITQDFKINQYGFYDVQLMITGRGELTGDHIDSPQDLSFDVGPIDIHGHWLVDVVNLTLGQAFGFVLPGGGADQIVMGYFNQADGTEKPLTEAIITAKPAGINLVPEPGTVLPLLLGLPLLYRFRRKIG